MRDKEELIKCHGCGRRNWHEQKYCSWCAQTLVTPTHRRMNHIMALIAVVSLLAIAIGIARW